MEPGVSLLHVQEPSTCPYPEPDETSPCNPFRLLNICFNIITHLRLGFPSVNIANMFL